MAERAPWTESAERRRQIVEAALPIFAACSYAEATTAQVARSAGISQATVFKHFATKRDLFMAVLERTTELVLERWQRAFDAAPTPLDGLVAIAQTYAQMAGRDSFTFRVRLRAVTESSDPVIGEHARASYRAITARLADMIGQARDAGQLPDSVDPTAAAWYFLSVGQGFNLNHYVGFGWDQETLHALIRSLFLGMGASLR